MTIPEGEGAPPASRFRRIHRLFFYTALVLAAAVALDNLSFELHPDYSIRGIDYLAVLFGVGFLILAAARRQWAEKISITVVMLAATLLFLESMFAVWHMTQPRPFGWYVWPPNFTRRVEPRELVGVPEAGHFSTNSVGIRGPEFSDQDSYRILCIGGSTTECMYLDDQKTWPYILGQTLSAKRDKVWVGNVGRSGTNTVHHAILMEHLPEAHDVQCWLVMCGINDMGQHFRGTFSRLTDEGWAHTFRYRRPGLSTDLKRPFQRNLLTFALLEGLRQRVKVVLSKGGNSAYQDVKAKWIGDRQLRRQKAEKSGQLPQLAPFLDSYEDGIRRIIAASRAQKVRLIFVTQPTLWDKGLKPEFENLLIGGAQDDGRYLTSAALATAMQAFNERLLAVCRDEKIDCVDLASRLPKTTDVFYDDCHFNVSGAARVAAELSPLFLPKPISAQVAE